MTREYDKLVRDDIPAKVREDDETPVTHRATGDEYRERLAEKLVEEAEEYAENRRVAELGDVLDVLDAICVARDVDRDRLDEARETKKAERGGFAEGVVLERVEE